MINKKNVFRYLGYKNNYVDKLTLDRTNEIIIEIEGNIIGNYIFKEYKIIENKNNKIVLENSSIKLDGINISKLLIDSKRIYILACTLGIKAERYISKKSYISAVDGLIADACMSDLTEYYTDECQNEIEKLINIDEKPTFRYSPGYGDLKLNVQKNIVDELNTNRIIGLNITDTFILTPRKSIIAILGIENKNSKFKKNHRWGIDSCINCKLYESCNFKKDYINKDV
jgi:hypothetical protein